MSELPVYLVALVSLLPLARIDGAALAWTARCFLDMLILFFMAHRLLGTDGTHQTRMVAFLITAVVALSVPIFATQFALRLAVLLVTLNVFTAFLATKVVI